MSGFYDYNDDIDIDSSSSSEAEQTYKSEEEPIPVTQTSQPIPSTSTSPARPKITLRVAPLVPQPAPAIVPGPEPEVDPYISEAENEQDDEPEDENDTFEPPAQTLRTASKRKKKSLFFSPSYNTPGLSKSKRGGAPKVPRTVKLKPLKDVLTRLITQIKKKDDYAFFLNPVDVAEVRGYTDVIKRPMDFGTMTTKVSRGRYKSLEEFADDFHLVTSNAQLFNPPGTIHHTEAARIEAWGTEQIHKAAPTVIQYEADWNIDIEQDNPDNPDDVEEAEPETPLSKDGDRARSASILSSIPVQGAPRRRPANAPVASGSGKKELTLSESLEPDGRMPGAKQGLGAFPPGSDFADTMLRLKVQKRRHITKKERLRIEKVGRPYMADGSLEYAVMEDPFSILSPFLPEKPSKPRLTPVFPPPSNATLIPKTHINENIALDFSKTTKRKHWTISRPTKKSKDSETGELVEPPDLSREHIPQDYGSFAELVAQLEDEVRRLGAIQPPKAEPIEDTGEYWSRKRAVESEKYLSTVVYGGMLGVGYTRSVAEFLRRPLELPPAVKNSTLGVPLPHWVERNVIDPLTCTNHLWLRSAAANLHISSTASRSNSTQAVATHLTRSLRTYPAIDLIKKARSSPIELRALTKGELKDELDEAEDVWAGKPTKDEDVKMDVDEDPGTQEKKEAEVASTIADDPKTILAALIHTAEALKTLDLTIRSEETTIKGEEVKEENGATEQENNLMKDIRMNLLALAKRIPIDKIAGVPGELLPVATSTTGKTQ